MPAKVRTRNKLSLMHGAETLSAETVEQRKGPRGLLLARSTYLGPLPPPDVLAEYERVRPGAAEFFFRSLETQMQHRQALETKLVDAGISNEKVGMWLAFMIVVIAACCATALILEGKDPQGLAMISAALVTLSAVFVYSRRQGGIRRPRRRRPDARPAAPVPQHE